MMKPVGASSALLISPEAPYPAIGGGALRTSALLEYLAPRYEVDVVRFQEGDSASAIPNVRRIFTLPLPYHSRSKLAKATRNIRRFLQGRPPLLDRYSGFDSQMDSLPGGYEVCVIEHFWCAPYVRVLRSKATRLVLDLHNLESELQRRTAASEPWPLSAMFKRFAAAYRDLERHYLPQFDIVLTPSGPGSIYPNTIPRVDAPCVEEQEAIAFSGNLEYQPNVSAVRWFSREIWPLLRARHPGLEWRLIGKNPHAVHKYVGEGVRVVGPVDDAIRALAESRVVVVPLLAGSGTRLKILEAWAAQRAVVSTSIGAEGLGAMDDQHLLIADAPSEFANAVTRLLTDPGLRSRLGSAGRELYLDRFTTEAGWRALERAGL